MTTCITEPAWEIWVLFAYEPQHEISNNVVCATSKGSDQPDQSLCLSLEYSMTVKLLIKRHLEFLSLKRGCTGSSESIHVKMPHCWKSHVAAHMCKASHMHVQLSSEDRGLDFGLGLICVLTL